LEPEISYKRSGYADFALILGVLALIRFLLPRIPVPFSVKPVVDILLTVVFLAFPLIAIYRAMYEQPKPKQALYIFLAGALIHGGLVALDLIVFKGQGAVSSLLAPLKPAGLQIWCIGLGALVAALISDRNILIPIGIFLIAYDTFLVLAPDGFTKNLMKSAPALMEQGALPIPRTSTILPTNGQAEVVARIGPADLVFLGTFFLALFRFEMKPYTTLRAMIPVLLCYLLFVMLTGIELPALVPIGLVTLIVNWKMFNMNKEEKLSTLVVAVLAVAILGYSATRPRRQAGPLPSAGGPEFRKSAGSPDSASAGQRPSSAPRDGQSTQGPR
jgi:hypothetical protein